MSKAFDPLAINPNDFLREPVKDIPSISTGEMIAADQANLAETAPREPPSQMGRAAAIAAGAAVGAAAQGRNIMRFSDVPKEFDIKSSALLTLDAINEFVFENLRKPSKKRPDLA
jgi:hypothetical protein